MIWKLLAIVVFMLGGIVAGLWILVEGVGAVSEGSDWIWYPALVLTVVPLILFAVAAARSRTRLPVVLAVCAAVLVGGVALTYPTDSVACTPGETQTGGTGAGSTDGLEDGALVDEGDVILDDDDAAEPAECK